MTEEVIATLVTEPSPNEWRCVRVFKRRVLELSENSLVRGGYDLSANFSWKAGEQSSFTVKNMPPEEPFRALLLTFRHFWANDEPSNFLRVLNIVARHAPEARAFIDGLRTRWTQALFGGLMFLSFNNENLTANTVFDLWLNAHYFHNEQAKQQDLDHLSAMMSPAFVKFLLTNAVTECCKAILLLDHALHELNDPEMSGRGDR